ncbi:MAG: DegT/DnrJ/EryC1/StrS family aminotransferase [Sedimentisphaerales bacterium]|nr:DegT/DnrJ/EryC1/StrS family aminotransferase [Sedimentisphaerales bacterium]
MVDQAVSGQALALLGGSKTINDDHSSMFKWPIVTAEHEAAVLEVLRAGNMSGLDVTMKFEEEYASKLKRRYALACNTGTAAIHSGFYGLGVGVGDEVICPSMTYWASILQVYSLGATPVFAEIDPNTLCIDPNDIEHRITERTKAIVVVHYAGMPCDMDPIMAIAEKHNIPILEDCSHAHGALYKGKEIGTFGKVAAMSLMSGKSFAIGEGGILFTDDQLVYERAILFGHYARHNKLELPETKRYAGLPAGGYKYRMHQLSSAFGRVQLKLYYDQIREIDKAMNYFCDQIEDTPGLAPIRPGYPNSTRGGWYFATMKYAAEELGGLSNVRFAEAVVAEGSIANAGCNQALHTHPIFSEQDIYGHGKPTRVANLPEGATLSQPIGSLPVSEDIGRHVLALPWFKHYKPEIIDQHVLAWKKVAANYEALLPGDKPQQRVGGFSTFMRGR